MNYTEFANYTNEELINITYNTNKEPNGLALELATRLERVLDETDSWDEKPETVYVGDPQ